MIRSSWLMCAFLVTGGYGCAGTEDLERLTKVLAFGDSTVRLLACERLTLMREDGEPAIPFLIIMLQDRDERVRLSALEAIQSTGSRRPLVRYQMSILIKDDRETIACKKQALQVLAGMEEFKSALEIANALRNKDPEVRRSAAFLLGKSWREDIFAVMMLLPVAQKDRSVEVRCSAINGLAFNDYITFPLFIKELLLLSRDELPEVRACVAAVFAVMVDRPPESTADLRAWLSREKDGKVSSALRIALGDRGCPIH